MENLNKKEMHILLHSLGWGNLRWHDIKKLDKEPYRNYFYTSLNSDDGDCIMNLVNKGFMYKSEKTWEGRPESYYFHVADEAIDYLIRYLKNKLKSEKPSRSKMRYEIYLKCDVDETFGEWLNNKFWNSYRKSYGC
jgi:hypothetical protein